MFTHHNLSDWFSAAINSVTHAHVHAHTHTNTQAQQLNTICREYIVGLTMEAVRKETPKVGSLYRSFCQGEEMIE